MTRAPAVLLAAALAANLALPTAVQAQTPATFPEVPLPPSSEHSYLWAYVSLVAGAGLVAVSFPLKDEADRAYQDYLTATDPAEIEELYDRSRSFDTWSGVALVSGEVLLAAGLYLRFMRGPRGSHLELAMEPRRCALSLRF